MSDDNTSSEAQGANEEAPLEAADSASQEAGSTAKMVTVHGKTFDVNDPIQEAQLRTWDEAHAKMVGRQTNELGTLRKFYKERQPSKDEAELVRTAKQRAAEGDLDNAIDMIFGHAKDAISRSEARLQAETQNSELWEEYFAERPELAKKLGRQKIKQVSSSALPIYEEGVNAFEVLDNYWLPLLPTEKSATAKPSAPAKTPATLTGKSPKPQASKAPSNESAKPSSIDDIFSSHSVYARKK